MNLPSLLAAPLAAAALLGSGLVSSELRAQGTVTLYEHSGYGGSTANLPLQLFPERAILNISGFEDKTTSLRWALQPGIAVTFYTDKDGKGNAWRIHYNSTRVAGNSNIGSVYNDKFSSFSWRYEDPSRGLVQVYDNSGATGQYRRLAFSSYAANKVHPVMGLGDKITSIRWWDLPTNVVLTFYENTDGSGREYTVMHNRARNGTDSNVGSYYNDKFDAWKWQTVNPTPGWIRMWTNKNKDGYHLVRYFSDLGSKDLNLKTEGYNDQVDGIEWSLPANKTVFCYEDDPIGGHALTLRKSGIWPDLDQGLSGVFHDNITIIKRYDGDLGPDFSDRNAPLDQNTYLSAHNAHANAAQGWVYYNQSKSLLWQLDYGVRYLQLDTMNKNGVLYNVHGSWSATLGQRLGATPETLDLNLRRIKSWLDVHKEEVIFLDFEHQDGDGNGTDLGDYLLQQSPIRNLIHVHDRGSFLSVNELVQTGKRVFCLMARDGEHDDLNGDHDLMVANNYASLDDTTLDPGSEPIDRMHRPLFFMNRINSVAGGSVSHNNTAAKLYALALRFDQWCNFINIDMVQNGGDAGIEAARLINTRRRADRAALGAKARAWYWGSNCATGPLLRPDDLPKLGGQIVIDFNSSFTGVLALGISDRNFAGASLPLVLPTGGACDLRISPDFLFFQSGATGFRSPVPNNSSLAGRSLYFQAAWGAALYTSGAVRMQMGTR